MVFFLKELMISNQTAQLTKKTQFADGTFMRTWKLEDSVKSLEIYEFSFMNSLTT